MSSCAAVTEIVQPVPVSVPSLISAVLLLLHGNLAVIKASLLVWESGCPWVAGSRSLAQTTEVQAYSGGGSCL